MKPIEHLEARIDQLIREANASLATRVSEREQEMAPIRRRQDRFEALARTWMDQFILPRLRSLAQRFPNCAPPVDPGGTHHAWVTLARSEEYPVHARVDVAVTHDRDVERARITFTASIIPILMECQPESCLEFDLDSADSARLEGFLDEGIVRFVSDYLRVRDPGSIYQRDNLVTDPVCGMRFRRTDAAASIEYQGSRYYFCVESCLERFAAEPRRYTRVVGLG